MGVVTAELAVPHLSWAELTTLGWNRSTGFVVDVEGQPLQVEALLRHLPGRRMAVRARWRGETVFAKLFLAGQNDHARRELKRHHALVAAGIATPRLRFSHLGEQGAVLIQEWISGQPGQNVLREEPGFAKFDSLLDCLFQLYQAGLRQLDLHLDNFLFAGQRVVVIDAGAVVPLPGGWRYQSAVIDNLALLCAQTPLDLRSALQHQVAERLRQEGLNDQRLAIITRRRSHRRLRSAMKKWRRESSAIGVCREEDQQWLYQRSLSDQDHQNLKRWLSDPQQLPLIKQGSRVSVYGNRTWVIKHYRDTGWRTRLRQRLFKSRADVSWVIGWTWDLLGVPTPRPAMLRRCLDGSAVIAFPHVEGRPLSDLMEQNRTRAERVAPAVRTWLERLNRAGFWHGDTKAQNILVDNADRPIFIDLDGAGFTARKSARKLRQDLHRFEKNWDQFRPELET